MGKTTALYTVLLLYIVFVVKNRFQMTDSTVFSLLLSLVMLESILTMDETVYIETNLSSSHKELYFKIQDGQ